MAGKKKTTLAKTQATAPTIAPSPSNVEPHSISRQTSIYWQQFLKDRPIALTEVLWRIKYYIANQLWLKRFLEMKCSVYHYGFEVVARNPEEQDKLEEWLDEDAPNLIDVLKSQDVMEEIQIESTATNAERIRKFSIDSCWKWFSEDNLVGAWIEDRPPTLLDLTRCLYSDVLGVETIKYTHGLDMIRLAQLPPEIAARWRQKPFVFLNPKYDEHYKVLKRSMVGEGFAMPSLLSVFVTLGELESKEFGLHARGWLLRSVKRHHKLGHEIKQGPHAGKNWHFWNDKKDKGVQMAFRDVIGLDDYSGNFDHLIEYPWPDPKSFDATIFEGSYARLRQWAGPLAQMLEVGTDTPNFMTALRADVEYERKEFLAPFLTMVIRKAFRPPVAIRVQWSESIFTSERLRMEMAKFASQAGVLSPQTLAKVSGFNAEKEAQNKIEAANHKDVQKAYMPLFGVAHNSSPAVDGPNPPKDPNEGGKGADPGNKPGTPAGGKHNS